MAVWKLLGRDTPLKHDDFGSLHTSVLPKDGFKFGRYRYHWQPLSMKEMRVGALKCDSIIDAPGVRAAC